MPDDETVPESPLAHRRVGVADNGDSPEQVDQILAIALIHDHRTAMPDIEAAHRERRAVTDGQIGSGRRRSSLKAAPQFKPRAPRALCGTRMFSSKCRITRSYRVAAACSGVTKLRVARHWAGRVVPVHRDPRLMPQLHLETELPELVLVGTVPPVGQDLELLVSITPGPRTGLFEGRLWHQVCSVGKHG